MRGGEGEGRVSAANVEPVYSVIGNRIRVYRETRQMSQDELGATAGLTRAAVANMENGKQRIMIHVLLRFCEVLNVSVSGMLAFEKRGTVNRKAKP